MKMVEKKSHNLMKNFIAGFIAVALLVSGVCFFGTDSGLVMASDSKVKTEDGGYAVKTYSATDFAKFRGDKYTYPKLTAVDGSDYQEWLFAGWFTDETCKTSVGSEEKTVEGKVYAKFVDADLSYIKCQVTPGTDADSEQAHMRVISTVDSKYYSGTGFYITYKGREPRRCPTDNVYSRLSATEDGMECGYSPIAFNSDAEYLFALRLTNIENANFDEAFYIQSYWETLDGTEVLGMSRYARIEDSYEKIVNVPIRLYSDVKTTSGSVSVTYDANQFSLYKTDEYPNGYDNGKGFTVTNVDSTTTSGKIVVTGTADNGVAEGLFVNLRLQLKDGATIESNTTFTVADETFVNGESAVTGLDVSNVIFKNYPVAYTVGTVDTSWYKGFEDNNTFVISSAADLYGLASIVNTTEGDYANEQFSGDTIILGSDITINTATLDPEADATSYIEWTPIGKKGAVFNGTFDGRGNTISGIYVNATADNAGLFGVASGSTIQEFEIKNSCFDSTKGVLGSVVGHATNTKFMNIRSNAYVIGGAAATGGIVGSVDDASAEQNISNCWFDGDITGTTYCGGIVGRFNKGTSTISDCLVTGSVKGNVSGNTASVGGIVGGMPATNSPTLEISTSISVGSVEGVNAGGVIGYRASSSATAYATLSLNSLYTTHTKGIGTQSGAANPGNVKDTTNKSIDLSTLNGHVAYDTIDGLSILTSKVKDGAWAIREQSDKLKDGVPVPATFADEWIDVAWYYDAEKSDDKGETYSISTAEELYGFSAISRGYTFGEETIQGYNFDGDTVQLANDITVNDGKATSWAAGTTTPEREWTPIGNTTTKFQGIFDGQGHEIKGIYASGKDYVGLFGYGNGATLRNFRLTNSYIYGSSERVGSVIGCNSGNMTEIYSDAIVESETDECGGLIGLLTGTGNNTISKCWFAGNVQGLRQTGGIIGNIAMGNKTIQHCLVTGGVKTTDSSQSGKNGQTGGIIGSVANKEGLIVSIQSCLTTGDVADGYSNAKCGGIIGYRNGTNTVNITDVYTTYANGGIGTQTENDYEIEDTVGLVDNIDDIKGDIVYATDTLKLDYHLYDSIWVARITDIPVPRCFVGTVVDENDIVEDVSAHTEWYDADTEATEFEIKTENDLLGFAVKVNEGVTFSGKTVKLVKDMDLNKGWNAPKIVDEQVQTPDITWTPIGNATNKFQGTFDGQGYEIKGIYASGRDYVGLFGYGNGATLRNFRLTNSYIYGSSERVGSVIGCNSGNMTEIYSDAIVESETDECGGLIGLLTGTVTNTISKCWFAGSVQGLRQTGGLIGNIAMGNKIIQHCLVTGAVNTTDSSQSGKNGQTGGMIGSVANREGLVVSIQSCLTTGDVTDGYSNAKCGGIIGYRNGTNTVNITDVYTTYANGGIGTQTENDYEVEDTVGVVDDINDIKGAIVYNEEKGINLNYVAWIARTNNIPVPSCFVGSIVPEIDAVEYTGRRVYVDTAWYDDNSDATIFEIDTAHELAGLAQLVNEGITFDNKTINLVKDIDFNKGWTAPETIADEVVVPVNTWMPIGNSSSVSFQGTFNGNGNTIRGIYVDENVEATYTGLFGHTIDATINDVGLKESYFSTTKQYMGSIIGYGNGNLTNVYSDALLHSTNSKVGGLVGHTGDVEGNLNVFGCWFNGGICVEIGTANAYAGGIVGLVETTDCNAIVDTCLYTGDILINYTHTPTSAPNARSGGFCGVDTSEGAYIELKNCIGAGTLKGVVSGSNFTKINGFGTVFGQIRNSSNTSCNNVYDMSAVIMVINNKTTTTTPKHAGTLSNGSIDQTYEKEDIFGLGAQFLTNLDFVQDAEETIWAARKGRIPAPAGLVADSDKLNVRFGKADTDIADGATGDSLEDPYIIENVEELYGFAILSRSDNFANKYIKLSDDIENDVLHLNPGESAQDWAEGTAASLPWYSIGVAEDELRFAGHFDGNGKTISGIYINDDSSYLGLFAATETGSTITNLRLTNSYINYTGNDTAYAGSVVGDLRGDMTNVYSDAIVNSNGTQTGGLIGQVNATSETVYITNCWYDGQLTSSKTYAGGLLASTAKGTVNVDNCLNTGTITTTATASNVNNAVAGICSHVNGTSTLNITDTIVAGKITDEAHGKNVKSVVGYIQNGIVNFDNVFATKFAYGRALPSEGASGSHTGTVIRTHKANRLIGYCVGAVKTGEVAPSLDFTTDWTIRTSDVPVPTCFADLVTTVAVAEGSTLDVTLNAQIGLDTLGLSIANAVDMGEGNYVLETTVNDDAYNNYLLVLKETLGFGEAVAENSAGAGADGVHSVSYKKQNPDWVLTLTYVETTDVLTISINTDIDSLSDNLVYTEGVEDENYLAAGDVTFSMLQMEEYTVDTEGNDVPVDAIYADLTEYNILKTYNSYWYGNSFVFQLPSGHFIINDGGARQEFADLVTYLKAEAGTTEGVQNPVYIDAWIVSHQHGDHFDVIRAASDALKDDTSTLMDDIYVDAFYINEPNANVLANASLDDDVDSQYNSMTLFTKGPDGEQADIYRMQTGQRYYFNGLVMDVIQAQEQISYEEYGKFNAKSDDLDFNTASTITMFTTANNQKILIGGDANYANMQYIMDAYGIDNEYTKSSLLKNINIFVAFHHGKNMSMNIGGTVDYSFIDYLTKDGSETGHLFDYVLYPCSLVYDDDSDPAYAFPNAEEANAYLNGKAKVFKHFGDGHVEIILQGVTTE